MKLCEGKRKIQLHVLGEDKGKRGKPSPGIPRFKLQFQRAIWFKMKFELFECQNGGKPKGIVHVAREIIVEMGRFKFSIFYEATLSKLRAQVRIIECSFITQ